MPATQKQFWKMKLFPGPEQKASPGAVR